MNKSNLIQRLEDQVVSNESEQRQLTIRIEELFNEISDVKMNQSKQEACIEAWEDRYRAQKEKTEGLQSSLGDALYVAERWEEAQTIFEELSEEFPENIQYRGYLGTLAAREGNREKASKISDELKKYPVDALLYGSQYRENRKLRLCLDGPEGGVDLRKNS